jgi:RHS repeat-associated protein
MNDMVLGFNGERLDPVIGSTHLGNGYRAYSPVLMRFTCPDSWSPFGTGGVNSYAYCDGDPINQSDPSGHISLPGLFWMIGAAIGLIAGIAAFVAPMLMAGSIAAGLAAMTPSAITASAIGVISGGYTLVRAGVTDKKPLSTQDIDYWALAGTALGLLGAFASLRSLFKLGRQVYKLGWGLMKENLKYEESVRKAMGLTYWKKNKTSFWYGKNHEYKNLAWHKRTERIHGGEMPGYSREIRRAVPMSNKHKALLAEKHVKYGVSREVKDFSQPMEARHMANIERNTTYTYNYHEMIEMGYIRNNSDINNNLFRQTASFEDFSIEGPGSSVRETTV